MSDVKTAKSVAKWSPGQQMVMPAMGAAVCAWVDAGDLITDAKNGTQVDFESALSDAYGALGDVIEELQSLTTNLDGLFVAEKALSGRIEQLLASSAGGGREDA